MMTRRDFVQFSALAGALAMMLDFGGVSRESFAFEKAVVFPRQASVLGEYRNTLLLSPS